VTERTLVLRFAGPAQSWASSPLAVKATEGVPTRSGVLGLFAAALGLPVGVQPAWLRQTSIAVRVDRPGTVVVDFHTVSAPTPTTAASRTRHRLISSLGEDKQAADFTVPNGDGEKWVGQTMVTQRAFLADAEFIVAVGHPDPSRLTELADALAQPIFMTYLGRKAFAPAFPFHLGVHGGGATDVLSRLPTSSSTGRRLPVHQITQDRNYASSHVTPARALDKTELWNGWKAA
jgi:CRISPR system Cascade subunit CasD